MSLMVLDRSLCIARMSRRRTPLGLLVVGVKLLRHEPIQLETIEVFDARGGEYHTFVELRVDKPIQLVRPLVYLASKGFTEVVPLRRQ